jgi:AcrR family transcriptional regulator
MNAVDSIPSENAPAGDATRDRILQSAERLFATRGFADVSVRDITAEAGVNLAAVNYHFGSKDALLLEIFTTRSAEVNRARARMLHLANNANGGQATLRDILEAMIAPSTLWNDRGNERYVAGQFLIRARSEGTETIREILRTDDRLISRFVVALKPILPNLSEQQIYWRLHFLLGMIHQNRTNEMDRLRTVSHGKAGYEPIAEVIEKMVDFAEAGFKA